MPGQTVNLYADISSSLLQNFPNKTSTNLGAIQLGGKSPLAFKRKVDEKSTWGRMKSQKKDKVCLLRT